MDFRTENLSTAAIQALHLANRYAAEYRAARIEPEHLLIALLRTPGTLARKSLEALGAAPDTLAEHLQGRLVPVNQETESRPTPSPALERVLQYAAKEAGHLGRPQVETSHLLIGMLYDEGSPAYSLLQGADVSLYELREQAIQLGQQGVRESGRGQVRRDAQQAEWARRRRDASFIPSPIFLLPVALMVGAAAGLYFGWAKSDSQVKLLTTLFVVAGWIVSLCLHEFGHALTAYLGGDTTVREKGYLTLNPLRYTHPVLSLVLPVIFLLLGGIGLPGGAVYIDRSRLRSGLWDSMVSAAGPLFSLLFAAATALPFFMFDARDLYFSPQRDFWAAIAFLAFIEASVVILNLIPLPPLDGFGILAPLLSHELRTKAYALGNMMFFLLFFVLLQDGPLAEAYRDGVIWLTRLLRIPGSLIGVGFDNILTLRNLGA